MSDNRAYMGAERPQSSTSEYNRLDFVIRQILGRTATATLVRVEAVLNAGELAEVGLIDVVPLVAQLDGAGNAIPHGTIHNVPYARIQGGGNAVILDPVVGDIGLAIFASHDISSVKATKAAGAPGSRRRFSMADALYIGGVLNGVPTQYIRFSSSGIEIKPIGTVTILGDVHATGTITGDTDVIGGGKSLKTHTHGGVQPGAGTSGVPS